MSEAIQKAIISVIGVAIVVAVVWALAIMITDIYEMKSHVKANYNHSINKMGGM
jgi:hypothetical protein